ncbi:MAG: IS3 family transposase [Neobacillus sp.]
MLKIHKDIKNRYGVTKINKDLKAKGITISIKETQRLMNKLGIKSITIKKYRSPSSKKENRRAYY